MAAKKEIFAFSFKFQGRQKMLILLDSMAQPHNKVNIFRPKIAKFHPTFVDL